MSFFERFRSDRGASMMLVAMSLLLLLGASAIAVDLAAMRLDRSADQKVTDSAASAGALAVLEGTGQDGCVAALEYVAINAQEIGSIGTSDCATEFSSTCTPGEKMTVSAGSRFQITVTYPVEDADPLMTSAQLGAPTQPLHPDDGEPCERVGVEMSATHKSLFAQLLGFNEGTTTVHSVARGFLPSLDGPPLNLLVLDRTGCDAILVQGGGGPSVLGGIVVDAVVDPDTNEEFPGVAAADSDASSGCSPSVIHATGNSILRADGPPCPDELATGPGQGCGLVQTYVQGITECVTPACQIDGSNAVIAPDPTSLSAQVTREQIDHKYNCWSDYSNPRPGTEWATSPLSAPLHNIGPCSGEPDHIYQLINQVGQNGGVGGFQDWTSITPALPCDIPSSHPPINVSGNVRIDCDPFIVRTAVTISDGNVIFDGNVDVTASSSAHLTIQNPVTASNWAFFRGGVLNKTGQAHLTIDHTMVYLSRDSRLTMSGGTGTMTWVAPDGGDFDDLALWSDSANPHLWAGQSTLTMEGVFFTPWARAEYSGNGVVQNVDAQWVAHRLRVHGGGVLTIKPKFEFPLKLDNAARTTIIR